MAQPDSRGCSSCPSPVRDPARRRGRSARWRWSASRSCPTPTPDTWIVKDWVPGSLLKLPSLIVPLKVVEPPTARPEPLVVDKVNPAGSEETSQFKLPALRCPLFATVPVTLSVPPAAARKRLLLALSVREASRWAEIRLLHPEGAGAPPWGSCRSRSSRRCRRPWKSGRMRRSAWASRSR